MQNEAAILPNKLKERRDIDKVVGFALGWRWDDRRAWKPGVSSYSTRAGVGKTDPFYWLPNYSGSIEAAQEIIQFINANGFEVRLIFRNRKCFAALHEDNGDYDYICESDWYPNPATALCLLLFTVLSIMEPDDEDLDEESSEALGVRISKIEICPDLKQRLQAGSDE